jgi:hypothetical protein
MVPVKPKPSINTPMEPTMLALSTKILSLVFLGDNHLTDPAPVGGQHFLFQAADGQHPSPQGNLAGHGQVAGHRLIAG